MGTDLWTDNESIGRPSILDGFATVALAGDVGKSDEAASRRRRFLHRHGYRPVDLRQQDKVVVPAEAIGR